MSELRNILADTVDRLLTDLVERPTLETAEGGDWPQDLWHGLTDAGLTQPLVPEDQGGVGAVWGDAFEVLHAAGRHAAPVPLAETIVAGWLLSRSGMEVPQGAMTLAPVRPDERLSLTKNDTLDGAARRVPWGSQARHIVALAQADDGLLVVRIEGGSAAVEDGENMARETRSDLNFDATPVAEAAPAGDGITAETIWHLGAMARSAQMAGALARLLADSVAYANDRVQFGRPIGKFQAIQQQLAELAGESAAAAAAAEAAFHAADRGTAEFEIAAAKIRAGEAAGIGARIAHQVHGAIGFTYEHHLHDLTRRLWSWRSEFGSEKHWAERLGRAVAGRGADALWGDVTAR